ncbi:hypothetical protein J4230_03945 [Candidatus Woesearchaeota archaeon]|nr:hypothetical protein [Candidatus Woesearchaeota archaeon]
MPDEKDYQEIKDGVEGLIEEVPSPPTEEVPVAPSPTTDEEIPTTSYAETYPAEGYAQPQTYGNSQQFDMKRVHELIEAVINEKWQETLSGVGNLAVWKEKINNDIISIKQELVRLEEKFEQLQNAVLGRVKEYDEGIRGVHTEMKALEKVFERILEPLTSNIKELGMITQELKKTKR